MNTSKIIKQFKVGAVKRCALYLLIIVSTIYFFTSCISSTPLYYPPAAHVYGFQKANEIHFCTGIDLINSNNTLMAQIGYSLSNQVAIAVATHQQSHGPTTEYYEAALGYFWNQGKVSLIDTGEQEINLMSEIYIGYGQGRTLSRDYEGPSFSNSIFGSGSNGYEQFFYSRYQRLFLQYNYILSENLITLLHRSMVTWTIRPSLLREDVMSSPIKIIPNNDLDTIRIQGDHSQFQNWTTSLELIGYTRLEFTSWFHVFLQPAFYITITLPPGISPTTRQVFSFVTGIRLLF